jgi:hypothetical protein
MATLNSLKSNILVILTTLITNSIIAQTNTFPLTGNAGIGTTSPQYPLHIVQNNNLAAVVLQSSSAGWGSGMQYTNTAATGGRSYGIYSNAYGAFCIVDVAAQVDRIHIGSNGNIGINTVQINDPNNRLFVEGGIRARKITVDQAVWPDYVFKS